MEEKPRGSPSLPVTLLVLGAASVTAGVALLCLPAGLIAGGVLAMLGGVVLIRGGDGP